MTADKAKLYCSFCAKSQDEVLALIAGPRVNICDECVDLCAGIIQGKRARHIARLADIAANGT